MEEELSKLLLGTTNSSAPSSSSSVEEEEDTSYHALKIRLEESRAAYDKLRANFQKLKAKLVDTSALVNLYNKSKDSLRQALQQVDNEKREAENLRAQLEQTLKETGPLREHLDNISTKLRVLQNESDAKDAQLKSARSYNVQLKAELAESLAKKEEYDQLQRECNRLRKELTSRDESSRQTSKKHEALHTDITSLETENAVLKETLAESKKTISSLQNQITELQSKLLDTQQIKRQAVPLEAQRKPKRSKTTNWFDRMSRESDSDYVSRVFKHANNSNVDDIIACLANRDSVTDSAISAGVLAFLTEKNVPDNLSDDSLAALIWFTMSTRDKDLLDTFVQKLISIILSDSLSVEQQLRICKLIVMLSKAQGNVQRVRVFCFDMLRSLKVWNVNLWGTIATLWPQACSGVGVLTTTMQLILQNMYKDSKAELRGWASADIDTVDAHFSHLMDALNTQPNKTFSNDWFFNVVKSFELVALFKGWHWTYHFLVVQKLWPLFNPASHTSEATIVATVRLIGVLGRLALDMPEAEGLDQLHKRMVIILEFPEYPFEVKVAAAQSICCMSPSKASWETLLQWFSQLNDKQKVALPKKLSKALSLRQGSNKPH